MLNLKEIISLPHGLSVKEESGILHIHVTGDRTLDVAFTVVSDMAAACIEHQCKKVLVDTRDMTGRLETMEQYDFPKEVPEEFKKIKIAAIDTEEDKNIWRFFETSARNHGYNMRTFTDVDAAKKWLLHF